MGMKASLKSSSAYPTKLLVAKEFECKTSSVNILLQNLGP